jgi:hypothetical protein
MAAVSSEYRASVLKLLRTANVTIKDQWEGSTGYISEAEANRLHKAPTLTAEQLGAGNYSDQDDPRTNPNPI